MAHLDTVQRRSAVPRILVVDDAPDVRQIHARFLHGSGMDVVVAENGRAALDLARLAVPDVVVTDADMPVMDGLDLCRHLRAHAGTRDVMVVLVTGDAVAHADAARTVGCDAVLRKPCSRLLLLDTVHEVLERRRQVALVGVELVHVPYFAEGPPHLLDGPHVSER
jgi:two-component system NtrC family sensor kinase